MVVEEVRVEFRLVVSVESLDNDGRHNFGVLCVRQRASPILHYVDRVGVRIWGGCTLSPYRRRWVLSFHSSARGAVKTWVEQRSE